MFLIAGRAQQEFHRGNKLASIRREITIDVPGGQAWDAMRDVGALHTRLVRGFVTHCALNGDVRTVTFGNGLVALERIITTDEPMRRLVWSVVGGRLTHHNASTQVTEEGDGRCKVVWVCDLLPDELAPTVAGMIEHAMQAMKATLESDLSAPWPSCQNEAMAGFSHRDPGFT